MKRIDPDLFPQSFTILDMKAELEADGQLRVRSIGVMSNGVAVAAFVRNDRVPTVITLPREDYAAMVPKFIRAFLPPAGDESAEQYAMELLNTEDMIGG